MVHDCIPPAQRQEANQMMDAAEAKKGCSATSSSWWMAMAEPEPEKSNSATAVIEAMDCLHAPAGMSESCAVANWKNFVSKCSCHDLELGKSMVHDCIPPAQRQEATKMLDAAEAKKGCSATSSAWWMAMAEPEPEKSNSATAVIAAAASGFIGVLVGGMLLQRFHGK